MGIRRRISAGVTSPAFFAAVPLIAAVYDALEAADRLSFGWFFMALLPRLGLALVVAVPVYAVAACLRGLVVKCQGATGAAETARSRHR